MSSFVRGLVVAIVVLGIIGLIGYLLVVYGVIRLNYPSKLIYPVQGVDISHHQGDVDFQKVADDGWNFVIMKSTEGGDWTDSKFKVYRKEAKKFGLTVGVYHYYSFCTDPELQAKHYIDVVGSLKGDLPPAVDLEFDNNCNNAISVNEFQSGFSVYVSNIVAEYETYPIVYCNEDFYFKYLDKEEYRSCLFWIRNTVSQPNLEGRNWSFWQYTAKGVVTGINGSTDLNAFSGRRFEFEELILK